MLKKLLKERFDQWCRMRWLKTIRKETNKRDKCYEQFKRHDYVAKRLMDEYIKLYPEEMVGEG